MSFQMSLAEAKQRLERAKHTVARVREKTEEAIGQGIQVAEVAGTAVTFGWANARFGDADGEMKLFGIPLDLATGLGLTGMAMFGGFGRYGEHAVNVGAGAIASYAYRTGYQLGSETQGASSSRPARFSHGAQARGAMNGAGVPASTTTAGEWDPHGQTFTVYDHQGA